MSAQQMTPLITSSFKLKIIFSLYGEEDENDCNEEDGDDDGDAFGKLQTINRDAKSKTPFMICFLVNKTA